MRVVQFSFIKSGSNFTPKSLSGLQLWLNANVGYSAGTWLDQSGVGDSARNATQATVGNRPTLNATDAAYNGKSSLSFASASDQYLQTGTWSVALTQPCTIVVVGNSDATATTEFYIDGIVGGTTRLVIDKSNATNYEIFAGSSGGGAINGTGEPVGYVISDPMVMLAEFNNTTSAPYLSSQISMGSLGNPIPTFAEAYQTTGTNTATGLTIGAAVNTSLSLNGKIREVIVYNRILSTLERNQLLAYISSNSGIVIADKFVVFDGNSNMFGAGTSSPGGVTALPAVTPSHMTTRLAGWYNRGQSGHTTPQLTSAMATTFGFCDSRVTKKTAVLLETQNDCSQNGGSTTPSDTTYAATAWSNIIAWATAARAAGFTRLVLCTCLPEGSAGAQPANYEALRQAVNTLMRANYATYFDALADIGAPGSPIGTVASANDPTLYAAVDTVHLTDAGTIQAAIILAPVI